MQASPFVGLMPFQQSDTSFFFGRDLEREMILNNLLAFRLTLFYGSSGVGKSSILSAGVEPWVRRMTRAHDSSTGPCEFAAVLFRSWRDRPVESLIACARTAVEESLGHEVTIANASGGLCESLDVLSRELGGTLLIILDQFEDYFLYHGNQDRHDRFGAEFARAVNRPDLRANFLISIREDALAQLDRFQGHIPGLFDHYQRLDFLDGESARSAIVGPLSAYNERCSVEEGPITIEPALVENVIRSISVGRIVLQGSDVLQGFDAPAFKVNTAYLQLVMTRLWDADDECGRAPELCVERLFRQLGGVATRIVRAPTSTRSLDASRAGARADRESSCRGFSLSCDPVRSEDCANGARPRRFFCPSAS